MAQHEDTFGRGCEWLPVRIVVTDGTTADCSQAEKLINNIDAKYLLADKGYDSDAIVEKAELVQYLRKNDNS